MRHIYQVTLFGLNQAIAMLLQNYATRKAQVRGLIISPNVFLRIVEELNLNNKKTSQLYSKIFMLPIAVDPFLLPFTVIVDLDDIGEI